MTDKTQPKTPKFVSGDSQETRDARLKAALRANLARRKAQMRGRAEAGDAEDENTNED